MAKTASEWVAILEAAYESLLTGGVSAYSIGGRSFTLNDISTIRDELDHWREVQARETGGIVSIADQSIRRSAYE